MNTTATNSFIDIIAELVVSASNLLDETNIAFDNKQISRSEYEGYVELYNNLYDLICDFNIGETSQNSFLRNLYDITKLYERLGNTGIYPLFAEIAMLFNTPPTKTNIEPIIAEIYCL